MNDEKPSAEEMRRKQDEGMMPELGGKKITIGTGSDRYTLHITESPIFYTKKLNREMQPIYSVIAGTTGKIDTASLINVKSIEGFLDTLINAAYTITERVEPKLSKEQLEQIASEKDLILIIQTQVEVNGIINFFKDILEGVIMMASRMTGMSKTDQSL